MEWLEIEKTKPPEKRIVLLSIEHDELKLVIKGYRKSIHNLDRYYEYFPNEGMLLNSNVRVKAWMNLPKPYHSSLYS